MMGFQCRLVEGSGGPCAHCRTQRVAFFRALVQNGPKTEIQFVVITMHTAGLMWRDEKFGH